MPYTKAFSNNYVMISPKHVIGKNLVNEFNSMTVKILTNY